MTYGVTSADIEARWRSLSVAEAAVATTLIGDAEALLDTYRSGLYDVVTAGTVSSRLVVMTICEAVIRVMANPDRLSQQSITADGGISLGWQFADKNPAPRLRLTDLDLSAIDEALAAVGERTGRTSSLKMNASTSWGRLHSESCESCGIIPLATQTCSMGMSDSVVVTLT